MQFGTSLGIACGSFAVTNIDDMFVLVTFFAEAATSHAMTPLKITLGQYIGFTVIVIISMIGFGASLLLPPEPIGFLGLLPILLGIWKFLGLLFAKNEEESEKSSIAGIKSILKVSTVTVMNGGDNIGTYVPLFSQAKGAEIAVYVVTYYILLGIWCFVAFMVMRQKHILFAVQKYAEVVIPLLYMGLGVYIVVNSSCYPWSIEHINNSVSTHPGETILAVVTTFLLLICIGAMSWLRLRKKGVQPTPGVDTSMEENISPTAEHVADDPHTLTEDAACRSALALGVNTSMEENSSPTEHVTDDSQTLTEDAACRSTPTPGIDASMKENSSPTTEHVGDDSRTLTEDAACRSTPTPWVDTSMEENSSPTTEYVADRSRTLTEDATCQSTPSTTPPPG